MRLPRPAQWLVFAILLVLTLAGAGLVLFAVSESGTRALIRWLEPLEPRLQISYRSGNLFDLQLDQLSWDDDALLVRAQSVHLRIDPRCLISDSLCIRSLGSEHVQIRLAEGTAEGSPLELAPVLLPLDVSLETLAVARLDVQGSDGEPLVTLQQIDLSGSLQGEQLSITRGRFEHEQGSVTLTGSAHLADDLPLSAQLVFSPRDTAPFDVSLSGSASNLVLRISDAEARLQGNATLQLDTAVPLVDARLALLKQTTLLIKDESIELMAAELIVSGAIDDLDLQASVRLAHDQIGELDTSTRARFDGHTLRIADARVSDGTGTMLISGSLTTDLGADLSVDLTDVCPLFMRLQHSCAFSGASELTIASTDAGMQVAARANLEGQLHGFPGSLLLDLELDERRQLTIHAARLRSAGNSLDLSGHTGDQTELVGQLRLQQLSDTLPALRASGEGSFRISGSTTAPQLQAMLTLTDISGGGGSASSLTAELDWSGRQSADNQLAIESKDITFNDLQLDNLRVSAKGTYAEHLVSLSSRRGTTHSQLSCSAALQSTRWRADCDPPALQGNAYEQWRIDRGLVIELDADAGTAAISAFCVQQSAISICLPDGIRLGEQGVSTELTARSIPARWLDTDGNNEFDLKGTLDIDAKVRADGQGRHTLSASIASARISADAITAGEDIPITLSALRGELTLDADHGELTLQTDTATGGSIAMRLSVEDPYGRGLIDGQVELLNINLAPLALTSEQVLEARGTIGGLISIDGTLDEPVLEGRLLARDGKLTHEYVQRSLEDILLEIGFNGAVAEVEGSFRVDDTQGRLYGDVNWQDGPWQANLDIVADRLVLTPFAEGSVITEPSLHLAIDEQRLLISGVVRVPSADIILESVPASAVSVSPDARIVGEQVDPVDFDYELDLEVALGENVVFRGFGARARLDGSVRLSRAAGYPLQARGQIDIASGRYTAWGQQLEVSEGRIIFNGDPARPDLRITAVRGIPSDNIEVGVQVSGDARNPDLRIFSTPAMDENRALYYLLTGEAPGSETNLDFAIASVLLQSGIAGANRAAGSVLGVFGVEDFRVDARETDGGTEVQLSGYLTPDLFLRYGVSTFDKVQTLRLRYRLRQKLFVEAVSGVEDAIDLLYSFER